MVIAEVVSDLGRYPGGSGSATGSRGGLGGGELRGQLGLSSADGPLQGLLARSVVVLDSDGSVAYTELVPEIGQEPDYDAAIAALS